MVNATDALERLIEGNRRFRQDPYAKGWSFQGPLLADLADGQQPFAAVLGCSDSRVPVEVVFGQGPGQLFVVRVAGNVVAPTQLGSVEFAVRELGVRLVVVLGHSGCGAVTATLRGTLDEPPEYLRALTSRIAVAIQPVLDELHPGDGVRSQTSSAPAPAAGATAGAPGAGGGRAAAAAGSPSPEQLERAIEMNVEFSRRHLVEESRALARLEAAGELRIVGAVYHVGTGEVELLDPEAAK